jgi:hypothetical protein
MAGPAGKRSASWVHAWQGQPGSSGWTGPPLERGPSGVRTRVTRAEPRDRANPPATVTACRPTQSSRRPFHDWAGREAAGELGSCLDQPGTRSLSRADARVGRPAGPWSGRMAGRPSTRPTRVTARNRGGRPNLPRLPLPGPPSHPDAPFMTGPAGKRSMGWVHDWAGRNADRGLGGDTSAAPQTAGRVSHSWGAEAVQSARRGGRRSLSAAAGVRSGHHHRAHGRTEAHRRAHGAHGHTHALDTRPHNGRAHARRQDAPARRARAHTSAHKRRRTRAIQHRTANGSQATARIAEAVRAVEAAGVSRATARGCRRGSTRTAAHRR